MRQVNTPSQRANSSQRAKSTINPTPQTNVNHATFNLHDPSIGSCSTIPTVSLLPATFILIRQVALTLQLRLIFGRGRS
jgi:hypothetical protein